MGLVVLSSDLVVGSTAESRSVKSANQTISTSIIIISKKYGKEGQKHTRDIYY